MVCLGSRAAHFRTVLRNWQEKTTKASSKKLSIMEHSAGLPQDTKSLRICFGNRAKMLLKGHLGIKCLSRNIIRSSDSFSTVPPIVNGGDWGCIVLDLETIIILVLLAFICFRKVAPLTNLAKVTEQGLCYCNSNAWGWHNSHQSGVICITYQLILKNRKKLRSLEEKQGRAQNTALQHSWHYSELG